MGKKRSQYSKSALKKFSASVFLFISAVVTALIVKEGNYTRINSKAADPTTKIEFSPTKIGRNEGYTVKVTVDGKLYSGLLDYDRTYCKLKMRIDNSNPPITTCDTKSGEWYSYMAVNGLVTIPGNLNLPEGYYLIRFKPRGADVSKYSNFDMQIVDDSAIYPGFTAGSTQIPAPPRGSYSILENKDANGVFLGYSRIDVETDVDRTICPKELDDFNNDFNYYVWRYTKTRDTAYWDPGPGHFSQLRWCVIEKKTPKGSMVRATHGAYSGFGIDPLANITVKYSNSYPNDKNVQGLLGAYWGKTVSPRDWDAHGDKDMDYWYMLYPFDRKIPASLSSRPITLVNTALGYPMSGSWNTNSNDVSFDNWHVEMLAPPAESPKDSLIMIRLVEEGWRTLSADKRLQDPYWIITEDWTFSTKGLFNMIQQYWWHNTRCWEPANAYDCQSGKNLLTAKVIESYIPDSRPLTLKKRVNSGPEVNSIVIPYGTPYELVVRKADGTNYSGFLELKIRNKDNTTYTSLWRDVNRRPIYVSGGSVIIPKEAYGTLGKVKPYEVIFAVRPYLTNSSLNNIDATADWAYGSLVPNASQAPYSNEISQTINPI